MADMIRELRAYDPKPGCRFEAPSGSTRSSPTSSSPARGAGWAVELNGATLPRLLVNRTYYQELSAARRTAGPRPGFTNACRAPTG
jgi:RNA polymerase sigma-54 factor